jgi:hypothetical protein
MDGDWRLAIVGLKICDRGLAIGDWGLRLMKGIGELPIGTHNPQSKVVNEQSSIAHPTIANRQLPSRTGPGVAYWG